MYLQSWKSNHTEEQILETEFMNTAEINQTIFIIGTIIWYVTCNPLVQIKLIRIILLMFPEFPGVRWEKKGGRRSCLRGKGGL